MQNLGSMVQIKKFRGSKFKELEILALIFNVQSVQTQFLTTQRIRPRPLPKIVMVKYGLTIFWVGFYNENHTESRSTYSPPVGSAHVPNLKLFATFTL
jgi:hypothetical protein